jgi:hypothetical protein
MYFRHRYEAWQGEVDDPGWLADVAPVDDGDARRSSASGREVVNATEELRAV